MADGRPRRITLHEWECAVIQDALQRFDSDRTGERSICNTGCELRALYRRLQSKIQRAQVGKRGTP